MSINAETPETAAPTTTREALLHEALRMLAPYFVEVGVEIPTDVRVSVGFGYAKACSKNIAGQCWKRVAVEDKRNTIFVSPMIGTFAEALGVLLHEAIHAALDCEDGHKGRFAEAATRLGLEGPMTATTPGLDLTMRLIVIAADIERRLGKYDHAPLLLPATKRAPAPVGPDGGTVKIHSGESSERNRWISFYCATHASPVRMSAKKAETNALVCTQLTDEGICMGALTRR